MTETTSPAVSRRTFMKGTALAGLGSASLGAAALYGCSPDAKEESSLAETGIEETPETTAWGFCAVNCHGRCALRFHVKDDEVVWVDTYVSDENALDDPQPRPCLRGRTYSQWINHPDRLSYPLKRTGKRGEGAFEEISWDEATDIIASELRRIIDTYGNESVYMCHGSGVGASMEGAVKGSSYHRLINLLGGCLDYYGDYSCGAAQWIAPYMYGIGWYGLGSTLNVAEDAELIVMFGNSLSETRQGGNIAHYDWMHLRENTSAKIYNIDPRLNSSLFGRSEEWIPINPGTDAALVAGLAHELIVNDWIDLDFLHGYCVGYDEETMPEAYRGKNLSYRAYIMGEGYDKVEKTPEWASAITGIPVERIKSLAEELGTTKPVYIAQGWGIQRRSNGEHAAWAIMTLPCLIGQVGLEGTNSGSREGRNNIMIGSVDVGKNPVEVKIPVFSYVTAVDAPERVTATGLGLQGADSLKSGIKCIINYAGNTLTNQHSDINYTHDVLSDESKCEFILGIDVMLTDSMKYADVVLPDLFPFEQVNMSSSGGVNSHMVASVPATSPKFERKCGYDAASLIAEKLGILEEFTEGKTREQWLQEAYEGARENDPELPSYEEFMEAGVLVRKGAKLNPLAAFREDPQANALATPSGKIEIFSEKLLADIEGWAFEDDDTIEGVATPAPIPVYVPEWYGVATVTEEYPLMLTGFHGSARTHSSFGAIETLKELNPQEVWINPSDAAERSIKQGDTVRVRNEFGEIELLAKVTPRIVAGTVAIAQGAWHDADMFGDRVDKGGNINTLTTQRPTPLAKANPQHTNICQVAKA